MKYDNERKKFIKSKFVLKGKRCNCCYAYISMEDMWEVKRFNADGGFDLWYYCKNCFDTKDELLQEIDIDSYPYGVYPVDAKLEKDENSWIESQSDKHISIICDYDILPNVNRPRPKTRKRTISMR